MNPFTAFWLIMGSIIPLQAFLIITFKLSLTNFCHTHPGAPQICHNFTLRGVGDQELPDLSLLASVSSDKGQQSLLPGTLVPLAGHIGLKVIQATNFNKNKVWITGKFQLSLINEPNTSL